MDLGLVLENDTASNGHVVINVSPLSFGETVVVGGRSMRLSWHGILSAAVSRRARLLRLFATDKQDALLTPLTAVQ